MASRPLSVPREHLYEAIVVVEAGLALLEETLSEEAFLLLKAWCEESGESLGQGSIARVRH